MLAEVGHGGQGVYNSTHTEIFTTLAAIAARTTHVLLGSLVLVVPFRHPVPLAKTVASLDLLSRGRLLLGVGAGWSPTEFEVLGVEKRDAAEIMEESMALMKQLWTGARVTFAGRFHRVDGVAVEPTPFHPGGPPIWVGGFSPLQRRIWEGEIASSAARGPAPRRADGRHVGAFTVFDALPTLDRPGRPRRRVVANQGRGSRGPGASTRGRHLPSPTGITYSRTTRTRRKRATTSPRSSQVPSRRLARLT